VRRIYDIVDIDRFGKGNNIRKDLGLENTQTVITFLGRARKSKGLDAITYIAKELLKENFRFLFAVQRIPRPNWDSYTQDEFNSIIGLDDRIKHIEFRSDIQNIYAVSDIIVMPSQGDEPCPAVALEAAASGRPIVATDSGATKELVIHNKTGYIVPKEKNYESLINSVKKLAYDPHLRSQMAKEAINHAREKFFNQPINQIQNIYKSL
jgi:glycosyltransferase involved in cell wall biosynthesis